MLELLCRDKLTSVMDNRASTRVSESNSQPEKCSGVETLGWSRGGGYPPLTARIAGVLSRTFLVKITALSPYRSDRV